MKLTEVELQKDGRAPDNRVIMLTFVGEFSNQERYVMISLWLGRDLKSVIHDLFMFVESVVRLLSEE